MKKPVAPQKPREPKVPVKETTVSLPIDIYSLNIYKLSELGEEALKEIVSYKDHYKTKDVIIDESKINVLELPINIYQDSYSYTFKMEISVPCEYKDAVYQKLVREYDKQVEKYKNDMEKYSIQLKEYEEKYKIWEQKELIEEDAKLKQEKESLEKRLKLIEQKLKK